MGERRGAGADAECVAFLQWALPRLGLRWAGFRRVRRQVCRRLRRRAGELGLADLDAYRRYVSAHPEEWGEIERLVPITISRFHRDRDVFAGLEHAVLPALAGAARAGGREAVRCWSAGCASGEEPYTLALMWEEAVAAGAPGIRAEILATDAQPAMLDRARAATYEASSLKELPPAWRERGFARRGGSYELRPAYRRLVTLASHDVRDDPPGGPFDLVLCRNLAFTYLAGEGQRAVLARLAAALRDGGALVIGLHEELPERATGFEPWPGARATYRRARCPSPSASRTR
jgi:chemotaxis protein methyltransferase CheR